MHGALEKAFQNLGSCKCTEMAIPEEQKQIRNEGSCVVLQADAKTLPISSMNVSARQKVGSVSLCSGHRSNRNCKGPRSYLATAETTTVSACITGNPCCHPLASLTAIFEQLIELQHFGHCTTWQEHQQTCHERPTTPLIL